MALILREFQTHQRTHDGTAYRARACAAEAHDGTGCWHGWIEFFAASGGILIRTERETTQPNTTAASYWANGVTPCYLEGALQRALSNTSPSSGFDYTVKIPPPDLGARRAILHALLRNRPHAAGINTTRLAHDLEGFSAAQIQDVVDKAAFLALEGGVPIAMSHLLAAYHAHAAAASYRGAVLRWSALVLPPETMQKLKTIERSIENPRLVRELGVTPPTGILLFGPPGTGKTTIARVLASETEASLFAVNAAGIVSKWLGESVRRVKDLFKQARSRVPAIVFIDQIDAVADRRGQGDLSGNRVRKAVVNTLLAEMDRIDASSRIFVIGATNRPDLLDEALLGPGRLGEAIEIGLPDVAERKALLKLFSRKMPVDPSVSLDRLAALTEGASRADLKGLCTVAGRNAFIRQLRTHRTLRTVTRENFTQALDELCARRRGHRNNDEPSAFRRAARSALRLNPADPFDNPPATPARAPR